MREWEHGGKKWKILFRERDYHGTTIATLATSGQPQRAAQYGPFPDGFIQVPHCLEYRKQWDVENYGERAANAIEEVILREGPDTVGCLVLEPVTAGGGVIVPPKGYWERVQQICEKYQILLHIDEVVCGVGRTGKWFAKFQHNNKQTCSPLVDTPEKAHIMWLAMAPHFLPHQVTDKIKYDPVEKTVKVDIFLHKGHQFYIGNCKFDIASTGNLAEQDLQFIHHQQGFIILHRHYSLCQ